MHFISSLRICVAPSIPAPRAQLSEVAPSFELPEGKHFIFPILLSLAPAAAFSAE